MPQPVDGYITPPGGPGLGIAVDEAAVRRLAGGGPASERGAGA